MRILPILALLAACATQPLTDAQKSYIGKWRSVDGSTVIDIHKDGTADFKGAGRDIEGGTVTISATSLSVSRGQIGRSYGITQGPRQEPTTGKWRLTLDNDTFTRDE